MVYSSKTINDIRENLVSLRHSQHDDILDWYDVFNEVRTDFFNKNGVFDHLVPASTGIGAANINGSALISDLMAIRPKNDQVKVFEVESPMQGSAQDYKSSFSRAVEVQVPDQRRLYISGTASIQPGGETAHIGDVDKQIDLTMRVVESILTSRDMAWRDTKRAVAYLPCTEDAPKFRQYCREKKIPDFPMVLAHAVVCRHDLLFEIELETVKARDT